MTHDDSIKLIPIKSGDKWGYIDNKGEYVINSQFEDAFNFSEGLAMFKSTDGKYGFINEDGKYIINPIYKYANSFSEGLACVVIENGKPQFINKKNKIIFSVDKADYCFGFKEGLARVKIKGKWGFIDKKGKVVVNPIYEEAYDFSEGLAAVAKKDEKNGEIKWGYINKSGVVKISFQFVKDKEKLLCDPGSFSEGLAFVSSDGKQWGCIDKKGKYKINPQFEGDINNPYKFKNGIALVRQGGVYGYINKKGKYIINPQFKDAQGFSSNNLAAVQHSDDKWGFINKKGKYEINPQFDYIGTGFLGDVALVESADKFGLIDNKGIYITNPQFDDLRLYDIGSNMIVKNDYIDNDYIAEMIFEDSNNTKFFGYDSSTTLEQIIDDYPDKDISDLEPYYIQIKEPKITISDMLEMGSLGIGFEEKTYKETPIYKTVQKYDYYYGYYDAREFVRMDKKIQTSAPVVYVSIDFILPSIGKGKGKSLAEAIKNQAAKKMNVIEMLDLGVNKTEIRGMYILKNDDLLVYITYNQDEDDEKANPELYVIVVNNNFGNSFEELAKTLASQFNKNDN